MVTENLGRANVSSQSSNVTLVSLTFLVQPVNFLFSTFFFKSSRLEYCCFGLGSCRTSLRLGAVVEVKGTLFSGKFREGTAPGSSLLQVGTIYQNIAKNLVIQYFCIFYTKCYHHFNY